MPHDTTDSSTDPQPTLADYCLWWPVGEPEPCYDEAAFVLLRSTGEWLAFSCGAHRASWAARIGGDYLELDRAEWEARGAGYRGVMLGG